MQSLTPASNCLNSDALLHLDILFIISMPARFGRQIGRHLCPYKHFRTPGSEFSTRSLSRIFRVKSVSINVSSRRPLYNSQLLYGYSSGLSDSPAITGFWWINRSTFKKEASSSIGSLLTCPETMGPFCGILYYKYTYRRKFLNICSTFFSVFIIRCRWFP